MAKGLSLVAGGAVPARSGPAQSPASGFPPDAPLLGARWSLPAPPSPTLSELFAAAPRDAGWAGFLLPQVERGKPLLWVQDRMAILESGRIHPPGLGGIELIHVEARDARAALWAMEEGLRCSGLSGVIGELWGDPAALDFTATRRLAVAAERSRVPCWLVRLGGHCEPQRSADALADRQQRQHRQSLRPARARSFGLGGGAVPRTRASARPLEHRA